MFYHYLTCFLFDSGTKGNKTFRSKKKISNDGYQFEMMKHATSTLGSGNLREAVKLPEGEDINEWVAGNSKFSILFI